MKLSTAIIAGAALAGATLTTAGANAAVLLGQYISNSSADAAFVAVQNDGATTYVDVTINGTDLGPLAAGATTSYVNVGDSESGSNPLSFTVGNGGTTYTINTNDALNDCDTNCTSSQTFATPAPEPAAWALMLVGFGALGVSLRSKRRSAFAA